MIVSIQVKKEMIMVSPYLMFDGNCEEAKSAISGMAICAVLPSRKAIEEVSVKLSDGGTLVQPFTPHPVPHEKEGELKCLINLVLLGT